MRIAPIRSSILSVSIDCRRLSATQWQTDSQASCQLRCCGSLPTNEKYFGSSCQWTVRGTLFPREQWPSIFVETWQFHWSRRWVRISKESAAMHNIVHHPDHGDGWWTHCQLPIFVRARWNTSQTNINVLHSWFVLYSWSRMLNSNSLTVHSLLRLEWCLPSFLWSEDRQKEAGVV